MGLKSSAISVILVSTLVLFLLSPFSNETSKTQISPHRSLLLRDRDRDRDSDSNANISCSSIHQIPRELRCKFCLVYCSGNKYLSLHFCSFHENPYLSIPFLSAAILLQFYILVKTAQDHFSVVVAKLSTHLKLSPSMGAVTLLALGSGAPDVFSSVAAVAAAQPRTGFGAILSAGTFVSALVVGFVAIYAAPFSVEAAPFIRDVFFYLIAALLLFSVYLTAHIYLWQAVAFVAFYFFFVAIVFWMDFGTPAPHLHIHLHNHKSNPDFGISHTYQKISKAWKFPVSLFLKLTIPQSSPSEWNRLYRSANIALCPLALLYSCKSFMPLNHPIIFLVSNTHFPLWLVVLFGSSSLAALHFIIEKEPPKTEQVPIVLAAFVMSVFWISIVAGELLSCLTAIGEILDLPPALLGLTVLAWGNSVGDLVADVAIAKAGQPAMAMAGCFAGPMFNMLFGLGTALVIQTASVYPEAYELHFHVSIAVAFVFLFTSLMGSLLVVTWCRFRVPRFWGFCLVGLYLLFILVSLIIAKFSL